MQLYKKETGSEAPLFIRRGCENGKDQPESSRKTESVA